MVLPVSAVDDNRCHFVLVNHQGVFDFSLEQQVCGFFSRLVRHAFDIVEILDVVLEAGVLIEPSGDMNAGFELFKQVLQALSVPLLTLPVLLTLLACGLSRHVRFPSYFVCLSIASIAL